MLIPSEKIKLAQRGYQPTVGDQQDIWIRDSLARLDKKLRLVDNKELRRLEAANDTAKMSTKMKEILRDEQSIISLMEQQKFNF